MPANQYTATIDWGDGTPLSGGTVSVSGTTFTVAGSHNFGQPSNTRPGGIYTVTVVIEGDGQQVSTTSTATVGGLTVAGNPPGESGPATAGTATGGRTLGMITALANPDASGYTVIVDWGDGTPQVNATLQTNTGAPPDLGYYLLVNTSGHTYAESGAYAVLIKVRDSQGFDVGDGVTDITVYKPTVTSSLASTNSPAYRAGIPLGPLTVATATPHGAPDFAGPLDPMAYSAVVDWGDGSSPSFATITAASNGALNIETSGHTYRQGGSYVLTVTLRDAQGFVVGAANPTIVVSETLSGRLSPQSDTGVSQNVGITNQATPTFTGNTSPGATVEVFATPAVAGLQPGSLIATGTANASGTWSATASSHPLAEGRYIISAEVVNSKGSVLATASLGTVIVNTTGPVVQSVSFDRTTATATITFRDDLSGLDVPNMSSPAIYKLAARPSTKLAAASGPLLATKITVTPGAPATSTEVVTVAFRDKGAVAQGAYLLTIKSGHSGNGIQDVAGNALDGHFSGMFPSGDGGSGGDFVALIPASHNKVQALTVVKNGSLFPSAAMSTAGSTETQRASRNHHTQAYGVEIAAPTTPTHGRRQNR